MRLVRNTIFWIHLVVGLSIALVIVGLAGTGMTLAFERQIVDFAEHGDGSRPSADAKRLDVETLLAKAQAAAPEAQVAGLTLSADPDAALAVSLGKDRRVQLNGYTGQIVGSEAPRLRAFFKTIEQYHRWLAMTGDWRDRGKAVTGVASVGLTFLVLSGLFLWFPRSLRWRNFRAVLLFNGQLRGKARDWNWHNVIGFWICLPLLVIALTGMVMSYDWANRLLFTAVGDTPPQPRPERKEPARPTDTQRPRPLNLENVNLLWADAVKNEPAGWSSITLNLAGGRGRGGGVSFVVTRGIATNPMNRQTIVVDRGTGEVIRTELFADQPPGRRARSLVVPIHRGEIAGVWGQAIACLAALGCLVLVYTGIALSWRRFFGTRRKRGSAELENPELATVS